MNTLCGKGVPFWRATMVAALGALDPLSQEDIKAEGRQLWCG